MLKNNKNFFITLEGVDGCGKSTQAEKISQWFEQKTGRKTIKTFEPYALRKIILSENENFSSLTDLLLFLADRSEHVNKVIAPALEQGFNVICERYNDSTLAYQAGGHALEISRAKNLIAACSFPEPDIKIFLDVAPEIAFERVKARNNKNDKFEAEGLELIKKVSDFYRELYKKPENINYNPCAPCEWGEGQLAGEGGISQQKGQLASKGVILDRREPRPSLSAKGSLLPPARAPEKIFISCGNLNELEIFSAIKIKLEEFFNGPSS